MPTDSAASHRSAVTRRRAGADASPPSAARYRRQAWLAVLALTGFFGAYLGLAGWFARTAWRLSFGAGGASDGRLFGWVAALGAAFLAAFMVKGLFFIRRGRPDGLVELSPASQPRLFAFLHALAEEAGAPRPHKVYMSARVNAAVFYDLSLLNCLLPSKKNLEIGLGLVNVLSLGELRAVLAHEFGHFAQRSMAVGRWVYVAQQVAAQLVARRDRFDAFLARLSRMDFRIAWVGWALQVAVWAIRSLVDLAFRGVLLLQRALTREMEMQADLVAVRLTGSDALVHALSRAAGADDGFDRGVRFALAEKARGAPPRDLFMVQRWVMARMAALLGDPLYDRVPPVPATDAATHRIFRVESAQPPRMWLTHPYNHEREDNAKRHYVPMPIDERPAWALFDDAGQLRRTMTETLLETAGQAPADPEATLASIDEQFRRPSLHPRYHGVYLQRPVARADDSLEGLLGPDKDPENGRASASDLARLYPASLADDVAQMRERERGLERVRAFAQDLDAAGTVRVRNRDVPRRELPALVRQFEAELNRVRRRLESHDRLCRRTHLHVARAAGAGWADGLRQLLAVVAYAEHGEAVLRDEQAGLQHAWRELMSAKVTAARLKPFYAACDRLHGALRRLHEQRGAVQLSPALCEALGAKDWATGLGPLELPGATPDNIQKWLGAVDSWVNDACRRCTALRGAALDALLAAEAALATGVRDGRPAGTPPAPNQVPATYTRLASDHSPDRRIRLDPWQRFLRASGRGPAFLRLAVAGGIVGTVLSVGAGMGRVGIVVWNGLNRPVHVSVDGQSADLPAGSSRVLQVEAGHELPVVATTDTGTPIEHFTAPAAQGFDHVVYNVAQAGALAVLSASYGPAEAAPPRALGAPRWFSEDVDVYFGEPPASVSTHAGQGATRTVMRGYGTGPATEALPAAERALAGQPPAVHRALALAHARFDNGTGSDVALWLALAGAGPEGARIVDERLRERPDDIGLRRARQNAAATPEAYAAICAEDRARGAQRPDDADRAYLAARCESAGEPRRAAMQAGLRRWPHHAWFAFSGGYAAEADGRFDEALADWTLAVRAAPESALQLAPELLRLQRYTRREGVPVSDLVARVPQLAGTLALERRDIARGQAVSPLEQAYRQLARGQLRQADPGRQVGTAERLAWLRLAAASDGAPLGLIREAAMVPPGAEVAADPSSLWAGIGLALREGQDLGPWLRQLDATASGQAAGEIDAPHRMLALVQGAVRPGAAPLTDHDMAGLDLSQRGLVYAAAAVALGVQAPPAYREAARRLLFVPERPFFG